MPLALLLSPDDQAVSAITAVLEEMSVTCERPLDGASAAQKLNSNRFDLVLVDCENLPAAKLIFDVCRNRKGGGRPVPVAVVDGRAGLPTAFRLGAELILTKPVAKDQARITIRTALSRVRKEDAVQTEGASPIHENAMPAATTQESAAATSHESSLDATDHSAPQTHALAAAAAAGSSSFTSFSDPVTAFSETAEAMEMSAAVAEPETAPKSGSAPATGTASKLDSSHSSSLRRFSGDPLPVRPDESKVNTTADAVATVAAQAPVDTEAAGLKATVAAKAADDAKITIAAKPATATASTEPEAASDQVETIASQPEPKSEKKQVQKQKKTGHLVTLFVLLVVCGGFYAAWTYEPGFQALAKSQINHLLVVLGIAQQQQPSAPAPARPASQMAKPNPGIPLQATAPAAVPASQPTATDPNAAPGSTSSPASTTLPASSSTGATTTPASAVGTQPVSSVATQPNSTAAGQTAKTTPAQPATAQSKSGVTRIQLPPNAVEHPVSPSASKAPPQH